MRELQVLTDNAGDNTDSHILFGIQLCYNKADIILFARRSEIKAGMGNGVCTVGQTHIDNAFVNIGNFSSILALNSTALQMISACI